MVMKPRAQIKPPVEVDTGLPQPEESDEARNTEPQTGLVIEPPEHQVALQPEKEKEAEYSETGVEPPDCIRPIYSGKFLDRMPGWPSPVTPPEAKKFFNFRYPPAGAERVFYGRANDPQIAPYLTHGIRSKISIPANILVNPQPITKFQQKIKDKKESVYLSNQRAPLGKSHDQTPGLPKGMDILNTTFGTASIRGEAKNRKYNPSSFHRFKLYGVPTPHFNDGRTMAKTLYWLHELQMKRGAKVVSKRVDDFKEKFQHKLGRVLDPIAETMNVPPDHTFGACLRPEEYGAGDLIHNRLPGECLRGKDRQRALTAAVRHHLKKVNYQNFDTLLAAFRHYDKAKTSCYLQKGDAVIDKDELREVCDQFSLRLDEKLLDQLFDYCDVDNDGKPDCGNPAEVHAEGSEPTLLIKPEDTVFKEPGSSEKTLRTLLRPNDKVSNHYKTTSSEISAIAQILHNVGVSLSDEEFENVWNLASNKHHRGEVCVENIRNVLDELQHADWIKCKTTTV
ncbi:hypothetical protein MC885_014311 [Smutsia gigantea]|nr:hypothetical protein MC885_014311 [Smutsia gigantea]